MPEKQPLNPYEVTPKIYNQWWELLREKASCERAKNLALEVGRLGLVLSFWMFCVAVGYGLQTNDIVGLVYRLLEVHVCRNWTRNRLSMVFAES